MNDRSSSVAKRRLDRENRRLAIEANGRAGGRVANALGDSRPAQAHDSAVPIASSSRRRTNYGPLGIGVVACLAVGAATAAKLNSNRRDTVTADVRVQLLNRIELATIKLELHRLRT